MRQSATPSIFDDIHEFHTKILQLEVRSPNLLGRELAMERLRFMQEELSEFMEAVYAGDITKATDGLLDLIYVAAGTLWFMGVPSQECWDAVQKANMAKVRGTTHRGNKIDAAKPNGWVGPEAAIAAAIHATINRYYDAPNSGDPK